MDFSFPVPAKSFSKILICWTTGGLRSVSSHNLVISRSRPTLSSSTDNFGKFLMCTSVRPAPRPQMDVAANDAVSSSSMSLSERSPQRALARGGGMAVFSPPLCSVLAALSRASILPSRMPREMSMWPMLAARFRSSSLSSRLCSQDLARSNPTSGGGGASKSFMKLRLIVRWSSSASGSMRGLTGWLSLSLFSPSPAWLSTGRCSESTLACRSSKA
mmetsp:Transcript_168904/g.542965  ORF Transcript_168904/g.542965 Transcript_168904/m.542965 type:complete len:217 (-) Transcript_168904:689-1339(-)